MEYGVHLPLISFTGEQRSLGDLIQFTTTARDLGYGYLCANDHLAFSRPWLDGPVALAAVLAHAGSMTLATTVALPTVRGPAALAKAMAAVDLLSGGKLVIGVGPGSSRRDYELAGLDFEDRWSRLDEAVQALRSWLSGESFGGRHYSTLGAVLEPLPAQRPAPPIWIGSWGSAAGLSRVARLGDGWLASGYNTTPALFSAAWDGLRGRLVRAGKPPETFPNAIATMWTYVTEDRSRAELVLNDVLGPMLNRPIDELREKLPVGPAQACAEKLHAYSRAGAKRVFLWPVADEISQLHVFRERVQPLVSGS
jgi:alkanesulfonate monooxygenase SsuD/methylene tetrahydromethanopterin reductase-like flavin-dependent oxidoreductase (luciferase family)